MYSINNWNIHINLYMCAYTIQELTDKMYTTIFVWADTDQAFQRLEFNNYLVVINEVSSFIGILTSNDLVGRTVTHLIDLNLKKPVIDIHHSIQSVIRIMFKSGYWELPVFDEKQFVGVITMDKIAKSLLHRDF